MFACQFKPYIILFKPYAVRLNYEFDAIKILEIQTVPLIETVRLIG